MTNLELYFDRDLQPIDDFSTITTRQMGKRVLQTTVGDYWLSTVWLGIDHSFGDEGGPIVFETMIFRPDGSDDVGEDVHQIRHASEEDAARWHLRALDALRAGWIPNYDNDLPGDDQ